MELLEHLADFILRIDVHLNTLILEYGVWTYAILFTIIFLETGVVVTPFLPGDSLLFAAGTFAAIGSLDPMWLVILLTIAAIAGDAVNYALGSYVGPKAFRREDARFLKKKYLERTQLFYARHGGKAIVLARFIPIIRTFAPFVAGIARMTYWKFAKYNVIGAIVWVGGFVMAGYYFGNIPSVKSNLTFVILVVIIISSIPPIVEFVRNRSQATKTEVS